MNHDGQVKLYTFVKMFVVSFLWGRIRPLGGLPSFGGIIETPSVPLVIGLCRFVPNIPFPSIQLTPLTEI